MNSPYGPPLPPALRWPELGIPGHLGAASPPTVSSSHLRAPSPRGGDGEAQDAVSTRRSTANRTARAQPRFPRPADQLAPPDTPVQLGFMRASRAKARPLPVPTAWGSISTLLEEIRPCPVKVTPKPGIFLLAPPLYPNSPPSAQTHTHFVEKGELYSESLQNIECR